MSVARSPFSARFFAFFPFFEMAPSGPDAGSRRADVLEIKDLSQGFEYITRGGGTVSWAV
ncbi:hypothetical protein AVDCRST_MAG82-1437 [uncultured Rubrobacteraceae bacterium]|uniref:Uncharacterized protein n=1 Tax=uncultured Rubrobacteraceae bacterium TaxID=349277 RepID=A0A6J4PSG9_9ACTN|nr:hypothetical protein AVDCRST_MAG82-1437 [uncultured Rubrobacteraceae bacterium]